MGQRIRGLRRKRGIQMIADKWETFVKLCGSLSLFVWSEIPSCSRFAIHVLALLKP